MHWMNLTWPCLNKTAPAFCHSASGSAGLAPQQCRGPGKCHAWLASPCNETQASTFKIHVNTESFTYYKQ